MKILCGATKSKKTRKGPTKGKECFNPTQGGPCHHHKKKEIKEDNKLNKLY